MRNAPHTEVCAALQSDIQKAYSDGIIKLLLVMLRLPRVRARAGNIKAAMTVVNDGVMMLSEPDSSVFPTLIGPLLGRTGPKLWAGPAGLCEAIFPLRY